MLTCQHGPFGTLAKNNTPSKRSLSGVGRNPELRSLDSGLRVCEFITELPICSLNIALISVSIRSPRGFIHKLFRRKDDGSFC